MGHFTSIRGWFEFSREELSEMAKERITSFSISLAEDILIEEKVTLYFKGWIFQQEKINWSKFIFYGAEVRTQYSYIIKNVIEKISDLVYVSKYDGHLSKPIGVFQFDSEDQTETEIWYIANGNIEKKFMPYVFSENK